MRKWAERGKERRAGPPGWVRFEFGLGWGKGRNGPAGKGGWIGFGFCFGLVSSFGFSLYFSFPKSNSISYFYF